MHKQPNDRSAEPVDFVGDIEEFHSKFGLFYDGKPRMLPTELADFRQKFLQEEKNEYVLHTEACTIAVHERDEAEVTHQLAQMLDGLVDLVYVAVGTAHLHGFDFREAWRRVHAANMAKVRAQRAEDSKRGTTYDVVKPDGWLPPRHEDLVEDHVHQLLAVAASE
ncbi:MAG: hypothetical protein CGW95_01030 [Phenylobacterium zucineum]|nr:MAG: hypothetical protein CGW95_01030 [Phenylobacterium zucineum]